MAREAGARKVYLASAAPPVRYPNIYGIDMPTASELVAHNRSVEEIRQIIGADVLIYQDLDAMKRVIREVNPDITEFEASCFDGCYIAGTLPPEEGQNRGAGVAPNTGRLSLQGAEEQGQPS